MKLKTNKPFRLGVWTAHPSDGRSLSRIYGPFNAMRRDEPNLEIVRAEWSPVKQAFDADWHWLGSLDALYLLDPFLPQDLGMVTLARACGCKVWCDYIDDLFNVPPSNPSYEAYAVPAKTRETVGEIIARADVVTSTTFTLACRLPHRERVLVLPEACRWPACPFPRQKVVTWRGSPTHAEDIESVLPALGMVAQKAEFADWKWVFIGFEKPDWRIARVFPNAAEQLLFVPWLPPYDFMNTWGGFAPYLHLSPLIDSAFNRAKTPLNWLEGTAVGAAVIGPALPEWNVCEGLLRYESPAEFGAILERELRTFQPGEDNFHPAAKQSRASVYPAQTLAARNEQRWVILNTLAGVKADAETERHGDTEK